MKSSDLRARVSRGRDPVERAVRRHQGQLCTSGKLHGCEPLRRLRNAVMASRRRRNRGLSQTSWRSISRPPAGFDHRRRGHRSRRLHRSAPAQCLQHSDPARRLVAPHQGPIFARARRPDGEARRGNHCISRLPHACVGALLQRPAALRKGDARGVVSLPLCRHGSLAPPRRHPRRLHGLSRSVAVRPRRHGAGERRPARPISGARQERGAGTVVPAHLRPRLRRRICRRRRDAAAAAGRAPRWWRPIAHRCAKAAAATAGRWA